MCSFGLVMSKILNGCSFDDVGVLCVVLMICLILFVGMVLVGFMVLVV